MLLDVVDWTPQLAAMIGIGVGIDYALLILNRFRLERGAGRDVREATLVALDTSGRAVLFAGIVVVIAMLGMMLLGISFLYGPAIGAALSVLATMTAALTLMPALLEQDRRAGSSRRRRTATATADRETGFAARWSALRGATGRWPVAVRALAVLIALALPAAAHAAGDQRRQHVQEGRHHPGRLRPAQAGLRRRLQRPAAARRRAAAQTGDQAPLQQIGDALREQAGIAQVLPPQLNQAGDTATMIAYPTTTPQDERTDETVRQARDETLPPIAERDRRARLDRRRDGDATSTSRRRSATSCRCSSASSSGLSLLLLAVVFRSLLIPVKAGIFNLLSIAGAFGVVTLIFQDGHGAGPVRRRDRTDRVVPADHGLRRRVRPVDGLRGLPRLAHARGVGPHARRAATPCGTAWR